MHVRAVAQEDQPVLVVGQVQAGRADVDRQDVVVGSNDELAREVENVDVVVVAEDAVAARASSRTDWPLMVFGSSWWSNVTWIVWMRLVRRRRGVPTRVEVDGARPGRARRGR